MMNNYINFDRDDVFDIDYIRKATDKFIKDEMCKIFDSKGSMTHATSTIPTEPFTKESLYDLIDKVGNTSNKNNTRFGFGDLFGGTTIVTSKHLSKYKSVQARTHKKKRINKKWRKKYGFKQVEVFSGKSYVMNNKIIMSPYDAKKIERMA